MARNQSTRSPFVSRVLSFFRPAPPRKAPRSRLPDVLRAGEFEALLDHAVCDRDRVLFLVMRYAGLRVHEATTLRIRDVDLDGRLLFVVKGKMNKDRNVPISEKLRPELAAYIGGRTEGWLFPSPRWPDRAPLATRTVQLIVERTGLQAGIPRNRLHPHILRHSAATDLYRKSHDLRAVQRFLGHSSVATTELYAHIDDESVRAAVDLL